ncbi:MAG: DMT family transporter [Pseudooceanicola sp.]|nr:DMT family transporter [Pseudooceanicola sp.]
MKSAALSGTLMVLLYTALISSADAITKLLAGAYAAPQLYVVSGGLVVAMSLAADRLKGGGSGGGLRTRCPRAMAIRSVMTVVSATCYFYAFRLLPFAEVFVFIGLVPLFAGLLSGPVLGEHLRPAVWFALAAGFVGVLCLFPEGVATFGPGHAIALAASFCGTLSMIMARYIGRFEQNALAQVLYPNLALVAVMALALPFVYVPMPLVDFGWAAGYATVLFAARWILVVALRQLVAYAVTPLMNLQFVWMVILGAVFFGEVPGVHILLGVSIVIASGAYLIYDRVMADRRLVTAVRTGIVPAE